MPRSQHNLRAGLQRTSGGGFFFFFLRRVLYSAVPMASIFAGLAYSCGVSPSPSPPCLVWFTQRFRHPAPRTAPYAPP